MIPDDPERRPVLEPLSLGDILDRSIRFYKKHFFPLIGVAAVPSLFALPMLLAFTAFMVWVRTLDGTTGSGTLPWDQMATAAGGVIFLLGYFLIYSLVAMLGMAAGVKMVAESYLGNPVTVGQAYRYAFQRSASLFWTCFVWSTLLMLGLFMCLIPGLIMAVLWGFSLQAFTMDGESGFGALRRSKNLSDGEYGRIIVAWLFIFAITLILGMVVQFPSWVYAIVRGVLSAQKSGGVPPPGGEKFSIFLSQFLSLVGHTLAAPFWIITTTLLYFDIRVRKEGYDLDLQARNLGYKDLPS